MGGHWTNESIDDFVSCVVLDFLEDIINRMEDCNISKKELAEKMEVSEDFISDILNNPDKLTIKLMVKLTRALNIKITFMIYDDDDVENEIGPIFPRVIRKCWEIMNKPKNDWEVVL